MKRFSRFLRPISCVMLIALLIAQCVPALAVSGSTSMAQTGSKYVVTASYLNFRSGPGKVYGLVGSLKRGSVVTYLGSSNGWWRVRSSSGNVGYVDRQYLTPQSTSNTGSYFVTANTLRIRKQPNVSSSTVGTVNKGAIVTISKLNGDWGYLSDGASARGWVALKYLSHNSAGSSGGNSGLYVVTADTLNVRKSASINAARIDALKRGTEVRVTKVTDTWGLVTYTKGGRLKDGWVKLSYLRAK